MSGKLKDLYVKRNQNQYQPAADSWEARAAELSNMSGGAMQQGETAGNGAFGWLKDSFDAGVAGVFGGTARLAGEFMPFGNDTLNSWADYFDDVGRRNSPQPGQNLEGIDYVASAVGNALGSGAASALEAGAVAGLSSLLGAGGVAGTVLGGASKVIPGVGKAVQAGKTLWGSPVGKYLVANVAGSPFEAGSEAGNLISDMRKENQQGTANYTDDEIRDAALRSGALNLAWLTGMNMLEAGTLGKITGALGGDMAAKGVKDIAKRATLGGLASGIGEGAEEYGQNLIGDYSKRGNTADFNYDEALEAAKLGAIGGGVLGGVGSGLSATFSKNNSDVAEEIASEDGGTIEDAPEATVSGKEAFINAIAGQESGGNYNAENGDTGAYGKYQIIPSNWPAWAEEAGIGADAPRTPENQEIVARFKLGQYYDKYGARGAAIAWYGGEGALNYSDEALNRKQGDNGEYPSINEYADEVLGRMGNVADSVRIDDTIDDTEENYFDESNYTDDTIPDSLNPVRGFDVSHLDKGTAQDRNSLLYGERVKKQKPAPAGEEVASFNQSLDNSNAQKAPNSLFVNSPRSWDAAERIYKARAKEQAERKARAQAIVNIANAQQQSFLNVLRNRAAQQWDNAEQEYKDRKQDKLQSLANVINARAIQKWDAKEADNAQKARVEQEKQAQLQNIARLLDARAAGQYDVAQQVYANRAKEQAERKARAQALVPVNNAVAPQMSRMGHGELTLQNGRAQGLTDEEQAIINRYQGNPDAFNRKFKESVESVQAAVQRGDITQDVGRAYLKNLANMYDTVIGPIQNNGVIMQGQDAAIRKLVNKMRAKRKQGEVGTEPSLLQENGRVKKNAPADMLVKTAKGWDKAEAEYKARAEEKAEKHTRQQTIADIVTARAAQKWDEAETEYVSSKKGIDITLPKGVTVDAKFVKNKKTGKKEVELKFSGEKISDEFKKKLRAHGFNWNVGRKAWVAEENIVTKAVADKLTQKDNGEVKNGKEQAERINKAEEARRAEKRNAGETASAESIKTEAKQPAESNQDEVNKKAPALAEGKPKLEKSKEGYYIANTKDDVISILKPLVGQEFKNENNGDIVTIGSTGINKLVSNAATRKSIGNGYTLEEHNTAAANIVKLFKDSVLKETHDDYKVKNGEHSNIKDIRIYQVDYAVNGKPFSGKITVKETVQHGKKLYSIELMEIEKPEGMLEQPPNNQQTTPASGLSTQSVAQPAENVKKLNLPKGTTVDVSIVGDNSNIIQVKFNGAQGKGTGGIMGRAGYKWKSDKQVWQARKTEKAMDVAEQLGYTEEAKPQERARQQRLQESNERATQSLVAQNKDESVPGKRYTVRNKFFSVTILDGVIRVKDASKINPQSNRYNFSLTVEEYQRAAQNGNRLAGISKLLKAKIREGIENWIEESPNERTKEVRKQQNDEAQIVQATDEHFEVAYPLIESALQKAGIEALDHQTLFERAKKAKPSADTFSKNPEKKRSAEIEEELKVVANPTSDVKAEIKKLFPIGDTFYHNGKSIIVERIEKNGKEYHIVTHNDENNIEEWIAPYNLTKTKDGEPVLSIEKARRLFYGNTQYSVSSEAVQRAKEEVDEEIKKALPGAELEQREDGSYIATMPNGKRLGIVIEEQILLNERQAEKAGEAHNRAASEAEGYWSRWEQLDGKNIDGVIRVSRNSRVGTAFHETLHAAMDLCLTDKEKAALYKAFAKKAKESRRSVDEEIADAYKKWAIKRQSGQGSMFGKLFQKAKDFLNKLYTMFIEADNKGNIFRKLESGEAWQQQTYSASEAPKFNITSADIKKFINAALKNPAKHLRMVLGKVSNAEAEAIKKATGMDVQNFTHVWFSEDVRHIKNRHGVGNEKDKRQIGLTQEDIEKAINVIKSPDRIEKGTTDKGRESIRFMKANSNGEYTVVEVVSNDKKQLAIKTMWNKKEAATTKRHADEISPQYTSETGSGNTASVSDTVSSNSQEVKYSVAPAQHKIANAFTNTERKGVVDSVKDFFKEHRKSLYDDWFDKNNPLKGFDVLTKAVGGLSVYDQAQSLPATAAGMLKALTEGTAAHIKAANQHLKNVKMKYNVTLAMALDKINKKRMDEAHPTYLEQNGFDSWVNAFGAYLGTERCLEMAQLARAEGKTYKFPKGLTESECREFAKNAPAEFKAAADIFYKVNDNMISIMEDAQVFDHALAQTLRTKYKKYCPLLRDFSDTAAADSFIGGLTEGGRGIGNVSVPLNRINIEGSERGVLNPLETILKSYAVMINRAERNKVALMAVKNAKDADLHELIEEVPGTTADPKNCIFTVLVNGKKKAFKTTQDLYGPIVGYNLPAAGLMFGVARTTARMLRTGATMSPSFILRNFLRDTVFAGITSKNGFIPFVDSIRGAIALAKDPAMRAEFEAAGVTEFNFYSSQKARIKSLDAMAGETPTNAWEIIKAAFSNLEAASDFVESSTRMGEYMKARKDNLSMEEAARAARESTIDFSRSGRLGEQVNQIVPFFNACLQGGDKMVRLFREDFVGTSLKVFKYIVLPSLLVMAWNWDKDWYKDLDPDIKNNYWCLGRNVRVPKPQEAGVLFGSGIEALFQQAADKDKDAVSNFLKAFSSNMIPSVLPTLILPLIEWSANYSFYKGRPLVGNKYSRLPDELQYNDYTSELSKGIGSTLKVSPMKIDNLVRGYTGTMGALLWGAAGEPFAKANNLSAKHFNEMLFVRDFNVTDANLSRPMNEFYGILDKANRQHAGYGVKGKPEAAVKGIRSAGSMISKIRKDIDKITHSSLTPERKRELIDKRKEKMNQIAKQANARYGKYFD